MKYFVVTLMLLLQACQSVPSVKQPFPTAPSELLVSCPPLATLDAHHNKLSDLMLVVSKNYAEYHKCSAKVQSWVDWYNTNNKAAAELGAVTNSHTK